MKKLIFIMLLVSQASFAAEMPNGAYSVDPDHATVGFSVSHLGVSNVQGRFNKFSGDLNFVSGGESVVQFEIDAASVDTNQSRRDDHIRSDDFFDVINFPKISFKSTSVEYSETGDLSKIVGDIELRGTKRAITFDVSLIGAVEFPQGTLRVGYVATSKLNRTDFGITFAPGVVGEEIEITVNLEVLKK